MPPTTPQAGEPQPLKGQKKPVGHALWLKCTRCWEDQPCGAVQICSTQLRIRFYRRIKRQTAPACRALGGTLPGPPAQGGTWPQQGLRLGGTAGLAPQPELCWEQMRQPIHGAVTPEPPPASRGPTCPQMTHAEIRSIADRKPCVNLIQHLSWLTGQSPPGYPRGQCAPHSHRWDSNPRSCRNAGPLSPLKQVAGPASAEERLGGGFSSPRSGVTLKCSHSKRGHTPSPALIVQRQRRASTQQGQSSCWHVDRRQKQQVTLSPTPQGSVPVPVCARVGRVMRQCPRSQSQTRAPTAISRAHPLEIQALCAQ